MSDRQFLVKMLIDSMIDSARLAYDSFLGMVRMEERANGVAFRLPPTEDQPHRGITFSINSIGEVVSEVWSKGHSSLRARYATFASPQDLHLVAGWIVNQIQNQKSDELVSLFAAFPLNEREISHLVRAPHLFDVWITGVVNNRRIQGIKGLRAATMHRPEELRLDLRAAKEAIDTLMETGQKYCVWEGLTRDDANTLRDVLWQESTDHLMVEIHPAGSLSV